MKKEKEELLARLKNIVLNMPEKPGSYQFYDKDHTIIYVGKAKRLKSRVSSYFHTEVDRFKTKVLVSKICDITYTVVNTEEDALLLENSLIKRYNPRYNVLLKDGKTYPSICITKEYLPRIFKTRTINRKGGQYFGPYSHISSMYNILDLSGKIYKPRKCHFPISAEGIAAGKYKPCLEYHIHNCGAPCCGRQSYDDYMECIRQAREILKGNTRELSELLFQQMQELSAALKFEEAEQVKQRYMLLQGFVSRSEVVSHTITDVDVFSIIDDEASRNAMIDEIKKMAAALEAKCMALQEEAQKVVTPKLDALDIHAVVEVVLTPEQRQRVLEKTGVDVPSVRIPDATGALTRNMKHIEPEFIESCAERQAQVFKDMVAEAEAAAEASEEDKAPDPA